MVTFKEYSKKALFFYEEEIPALLEEHLTTKKNNIENLIDLGAGDGVLLLALNNKGLLKNIKSTAVDLSSERCERLKKYSEIDVICSDVTNIPEINNCSMDMVISTQVIEHVEEEKFLNEVYRILRKNGKCYIASLISKYGEQKNFILKHGWKYGWRFYKNSNGRYYVDPTHLREYKDLYEYAEVFEKNGFKILKINEYPLEISILDFIYRRIVVKFIKINNPNIFFERYVILKKLRQWLKVQPPGYFICEVLIEKSI
jgi:ubiquinone/menaquinone biosynthesis C-methylase UbiE